MKGKEQQRHENNNINNNNNKRYAFYVVAFAVLTSIILSLISWYRTSHGDIAEKNAQRMQPGEELSYFAQRLKAEVVSENIGLVQHSRVGGFALQIQKLTPANTSLVAVPISSCLSVSNLRQQKMKKRDNNEEDEENKIENVFKLLDEFKKTEFNSEKNSEWFSQLGLVVNVNNNNQNEKQKETIWEQVQLVTFLIEARKFCEISTTMKSHQNGTSPLSGSLHHWCPWIKHIVLPNSETFLPFSDFRWRPEVTSRCLRQSNRMSYEATLLQVSAITKMYSTIFPGKTATARPLVEWALFVLRTRGHQVPSTGETILIPLLDLNDKRVGAHLYRKSTRQSATAAVVFDEKDGKVHLVTTEKHNKGAYPLTSPASWNSVVMSPVAVIQNYGTVPHAINNNNNNNNKQETENFFATEHFFAVQVPDKFWEGKMIVVEDTSSACTSLTNKLYFNISSGFPDARTNECLLKSKKNNGKKFIRELILQAKQSSLSAEALFACKSVAAKQKEGFITDKVKILGGKQAQALIDLDELIILKGVEKALEHLSQ
jgi:hypothetical protein